MPHNAHEVREDRYVTAISSRLQWLSGRAVGCCGARLGLTASVGATRTTAAVFRELPGSPRANPADAGQPCLIQPMTGSWVSIASGLCWQSHHVPPRQDACSWRRQHRQIMFLLSPARRWP
jgi:hypothetical protein